MFAIIAVPFDAFQALPRPEHRWLLTCFSRYVDRAGTAFPSLRQLAADARMSLASVSRRMAELARLEVFHRERKPGGRYRYVLAEAYRPRWPGRAALGVPAAERGVSRAGTQEVEPTKQAEGARRAIRQSQGQLRRDIRRAGQMGRPAAVVAAIALLAAALGPEAD